MALGSTEQKLESINDEGFFEKLCTAVLRDADIVYRTLTHPGVNAEGKTVKSPVDGIGFVPAARPPHMVMVHHTTTAPTGLANKWLHDPATSRPGRSQMERPPGDVRKAMEIAAEQRRSEPGMLVTLALTTNHEPDEKTIRQVHAVAASAEIDIDFWTRSRIAHFLDTDPQGQWLRRLYFGDNPERLSRAFLQELSRKSLANFPLPDSPELWIERALDHQLSNVARLGICFLVAHSGLGKSTACYRLLERHIASGGAGLVLPAGIIADALTLDDAIQAVLKQLHPGLVAGSGSDAISLSTYDYPLLLIVEDINTSGQATALAEKITSWDRRSKLGQQNTLRSYRLICPVWPEILSAMHQHSKIANANGMILAGAFSPDEGRAAVLRRANMSSFSISDMQAEAVARTLANDPLLIALHDPAQKVASANVIGDFIENQIFRITRMRNTYPTAKYRLVLRTYAAAALCRRNLDPEWIELESWDELTDTERQVLGQLAQDGSILRLIGSSADQRIAYRHDRVREWLLIDAAVDLVQRNRLDDTILCDPYFAEVIAGVLASGMATEQFIEAVRHMNPLALFAALRQLPVNSITYRQVVQAIELWLDDPQFMSPALSRMRWDAAAALAETEAPDIVRFVALLRDHGWTAFRARLRNGDITGGIELCRRIEPGTIAEWRDIQLDHAKRRFGIKLIEKIDEVLRQVSLPVDARIGLLRMAGHMADARLGPAIEASWRNDNSRGAHLDDYLWAFSQCCGDEPEKYLKAVCDAWAALPVERTADYRPSPRDDLAANHVRWAFRRWVPRAAIPYFIDRAENDDLKWQITYMLSEIDDPVSIAFIVQEAAAMERRIEGTKSFSLFSSDLPRVWRRLQENGEPMSTKTRAVLENLWLNLETEKHVRRQAFRIWSATHSDNDLAILRRADLSPDLADEILRQRLERVDHEAVPALLERISGADNTDGWWWHSVKYVWSDRMIPLLDSELSRRACTIQAVWQHGAETDYQTTDLLMRLGVSDSERLLTKYWPSLRYVSNFVQVAIYVGTPALQESVRNTMAEYDQPSFLLQFLGHHLGLHMKDHPGITRPTQIESLAPYIKFLERYTVIELWELCNERGWFEVRRSNLDQHMRENGGVPFEDEESNFVHLDELMLKNEFYRVDDWIKRYAQARATDATILACFARWLASRQTIDAVRVVSEALIQIGCRADLSILDFPVADPNGSLDSIKANTNFPVQRRTLT